MIEEVKKRRRRKGFTRVSSKNQVTLPVDVLTIAGVRPGDSLVVEARVNGEIVLRREEDPLTRFLGVFDGVYPPNYLDELRDEWA
jgi:bifunctional DNA-binding transcriptional regulator/antitoxin component of YhaV-PrlF toxin-antitoxin module